MMRGHWLAPGTSRHPLIVGHRGAAGHAPENTLLAFVMGLAMGADIVECDVHPTRDGRLAVIHDATVDRTTNGTGPVVNFGLSEIQSLDAGSWRGLEFAGQRVPVLEELLELVRGRARVAIEVKQPPIPYPNVEALLVETLRRTGMVGDAIVISFNHPTVRGVRQLCPEMVVGALFHARPTDAVALARLADAQAVLPEQSLVTAESVEEAHQAGLAIVPWSVNEPDQMARLLKLGVDGVVSDYPDRLAAVGGTLF